MRWPRRCSSRAPCLAQERAIPLENLKSGSAFLGEDLRSLQNDDFANPGMLWVERGEKLWSEPAGKTKQSCASCHQDAKTSMRGVAARYPKIDAESGRLLNLEGRINLCRARRMGASPFRYESEELLALTAYVARAVARLADERVHRWARRARTSMRAKRPITCGAAR